MAIAIVGTGWYGCYVAEYLVKTLPDITIVMYDKNSTIMDESSRYNQNRLHLGYHYARSTVTRDKCLKYYSKFIQKYDNLVKTIDHNYYGVSNNSLVNFDDYISKYKNLSHTIVDTSGIGITGVQKDKVLNVQECFIDNKSSRDYFMNIFKQYYVSFHMKTLVHSINKDGSISFTSNSSKIMTHYYDVVINCTYNQLETFGFPVVYEKCLTLLYKNISDVPFDALTIVDGPFCSLYPYCDDLYTLTDVVETPLIKSSNFEYVKSYDVNENVINRKKPAFQNNICLFYPNFLDKFKYHGYFTSYKCKNETENDDRDINYNINGRVLSLWCGKISFIFELDDIINDFMIKTGCVFNKICKIPQQIVPTASIFDAHTTYMIYDYGNGLWNSKISVMEMANKITMVKQSNHFLFNYYLNLQESGNGTFFCQGKPHKIYSRLVNNYNILQKSLHNNTIIKTIPDKCVFLHTTFTGANAGHDLLCQLKVLSTYLHNTNIKFVRFAEAEKDINYYLFKHVVDESRVIYVKQGQIYKFENELLVKEQGMHDPFDYTDIIKMIVKTVKNNIESMYKPEYLNHYIGKKAILIKNTRMCKIVRNDDMVDAEILFDELTKLGWVILNPETDSFDKFVYTLMNATHVVCGQRGLSCANQIFFGEHAKLFLFRDNDVNDSMLVAKPTHDKMCCGLIYDKLLGMFLSPKIIKKHHVDSFIGLFNQIDSGQLNLIGRIL
jgi:hypothetical protein